MTIVSSAPDEKERRKRRYDQRQDLWDYSTLKRVQVCGRCPLPTGASIHATHDDKSHFAGLRFCGSVWACPVCSAKIRAERAQELTRTQSAWQTLHPTGSIMLLTLTAPHGRGDKLNRMMDIISKGWAAVMSGRPWRTDCETYGVGDSVRGWDATHGGHGWHPHLHCMLFSERALTDKEVESLEYRLHRRWSASIRQQGRKGPSRARGTRLEIARNAEDVGQYLAKVSGTERPTRMAMEVARGDLKKGKGGRTPWQVLEEFSSTGDLDALELWQEWERATKGRQFMRWSNGLKAKVALVERTDQELAEQEDTAESIEIYRFSRDEWEAVVHTRRSMSHLLQLATEEGAALAVSAYAWRIVRDYQQTDTYKKKRAARQRRTQTTEAR